jgi:hypothetical protein
MKSYLDASIRSWSEDAVLVSAIAAANTDRAGYDQGKIDSLDTAQKAEVGQADTPTVTPILANTASDFLRSQVEASGSKITEAFITDARGPNAAVSSATSDMWQGDEDKFAKVFPISADGVFFWGVELDESTQTYQSQISIAITDPVSNAVTGTLTVGVNAGAL